MKQWPASSTVDSPTKLLPTIGCELFASKMQRGKKTFIGPTRNTGDSYGRTHVSSGWPRKLEGTDGLEFGMVDQKRAEKISVSRCHGELSQGRFWLWRGHGHVMRCSPDDFFGTNLDQIWGDSLIQCIFVCWELVEFQIRLSDQPPEDVVEDIISHVVQRFPRWWAPKYFWEFWTTPILGKMVQFGEHIFQMIGSTTS